MKIDTNLFSFLYKLISSYQQHLLKMPFFHCIILASLSKNRCSKVCELILGSLILFHLPVCLFACQKQAVFQCGNSIVVLNVRDGNASRSSFIIQDSFGCPRFLFSI